MVKLFDIFNLIGIFFGGGGGWYKYLGMVKKRPNMAKMFLKN